MTETPGVALADAGYWHQVQMQNIAARGLLVLVPPDASKRAGARPDWNDGMSAFMRRLLATELGAVAAYEKAALYSIIRSASGVPGVSPTCSSMGRGSTKWIRFGSFSTMTA